MMKNLLVAVLLVALFSQCKKNVSSETPKTPTADLTQNVGNINQMIVPSGFNYRTSRNINVQVIVTNSEFGTQKQRIEIYDGNPVSNGNLIASGSADFQNSFSSNISLPNAVDVIYVVKRNPDNSTVTQKVPANSPVIILSDLGKRGLSLGKSMPASPDCNSGCTSTVTGNQTVSLNTAGAVVCITGIFNGNIDLNRGTVRICGNATIGNCNMNNNSTLLIAAGATVTFSNFNINGNTAVFSNWSNNVSISGGFSPGGIVNNYGSMSVAGTFNINGSAIVTNEGTINIAQSLNNNKTLINNGTINVSESFAQNGGGAFTNNCKFVVNKDAALNNPITNTGYIRVIQSTTVNGGGNIILSNGAMFRSNNMTINGNITGTGTTSLVKVASNTTINGGGRITGTIQYCDANGIETNTGTIGSGVSLACNQYIPVSSCNPDGNGVIIIPDTDGDGANDNIDEYPTDPALAFNNYYPDAKGTATVAFEDLWPNRGDYDLNDLVVDFRHNIITNASNNIAKYVGYYRLRASGGAQHIAFCMGMPISADLIDKLEGATQETEHSNVVFEVFADSKKELSNWNTVPSQPKVEYKEYNVSFIVNKGGSLKELGGVAAFDPFIWMNEKEKGRGYEIHVPGNAPTKLADTKVFGYADDDTQLEKSKYYLTKTNLPWAIIVPETFDYCSELSQLGLKETPDITQTYLHFAQWAQSDGKIYADWYKDLEGYRNKEYIYSK
ncbi:MAG: hypothetical protein CFE21_05580 [Bacteroidetes bacterium B1(2017)]|nr:MAG: hypothetical protein CFE21_05580 [Bacteroidetes bacterium B1(2017)]